MSRKKRKPFIKKRTKNKIKRKCKNFWQKNHKKIIISIVLLVFCMIPSDLKLSLIQKFPAPELETEYAAKLQADMATETISEKELKKMQKLEAKAAKKAAKEGSEA